MWEWGEKIKTFSFSLFSSLKDMYPFLPVFPPLDLPTDDPFHESVDRQVTTSYNYSLRRFDAKREHHVRLSARECFLFSPASKDREGLSSMGLCWEKERERRVRKRIGWTCIRGNSFCEEDIRTKRLLAD